MFTPSLRQLGLSLTLTSLLSLMGCATSPSAVAAEAIHVSGRGAVETVPDMGKVQLHARREGNDPAALERELAGVVSALLKVTATLQIDATDVTATALRIQPRYQRRGEDMEVNGVIATRSISITLRKLSDFPSLLEQALAAGINNVDPIALDSSIRKELEAQALDQAMADAIARADQVARGFSVLRGELVDVQVSGHSASPRMAMQEMRADSGATMAPGVIRIENQVQATFTIARR
jgi:uncharacterized protein YggE